MVVRNLDRQRDERTEQLLDQQRMNRMFHALADAARRDIVTHVLQGEASVSALAERYPMSFAAVQKHVAVLERAEIVNKRRRGREQMVSANIVTVRRAGQLLDRLENLWQQRVDRIGEILAEPEQGRT